MTKLQLTTKYLLSKLANGTGDEEKEKELSETLKSFACDVANLITGLRKRNVDIEAVKDLLEDYEINFNGKSEKFS